MAPSLRQAQDGLVVPAVMIAIMIVVPVMVVFEAAMFTFPVAVEVAAAFVSRSDPMRARVRRTAPIAFMPAIMAVHGIPIAIDPKIIWPGTRGNDVVARRRRRSDLDADSDLRSGVMSAKQEH